MATSTRRKDFCSVSQSPLGRFAIFCAERHCVQEELRDCIERCRPLDLAPDFGTSVARASNVTAKPPLFGPATIGPPHTHYRRFLIATADCHRLTPAFTFY